MNRNALRMRTGSSRKEYLEHALIVFVRRSPRPPVGSSVRFRSSRRKSWIFTAIALIVKSLLRRSSNRVGARNEVTSRVSGGSPRRTILPVPCLESRGTKVANLAERPAVCRAIWETVTLYGNIHVLSVDTSNEKVTNSPPNNVPIPEPSPQLYCEVPSGVRHALLPC